MNRTFFDFRDRIQAHDLSHPQLQELDRTTTQLEALVKDARNPGSDSPLGASGPAAPNIDSSRIEGSDASRGDAEGQSVPIWIDQSTLNGTNKPRHSDMEVGLGYTMYLPEQENFVPDGDYFNLNTDSQQIVPAQASYQSPEDDPFDIFRAEIEQPIPFVSQPNPPKSYSSQETTFARRLHRACLENAYQLVLDPLRNPGRYHKVFKLSLMGRERSKILAGLRMILNRGPHEDLNFWEAPLIHVGGAGTHYPPRDA